MSTAPGISTIKRIKQLKADMAKKATTELSDKANTTYQQGSDNEEDIPSAPGLVTKGASGMKRCYGGGSRPGTRSSPHGMEKNEGQQSKGITGKNSRSDPPLKKAKKSETARILEPASNSAAADQPKDSTEKFDLDEAAAAEKWKKLLNAAKNRKSRQGGKQSKAPSSPAANTRSKNATSSTTSVPNIKDLTPTSELLEKSQAQFKRNNYRPKLGEFQSQTTSSKVQGPAVNPPEINKVPKGTQPQQATHSKDTDDIDMSQPEALTKDQLSSPEINAQKTPNITEEPELTSTNPSPEDHDALQNADIHSDAGVGDDTAVVDDAATEEDASVACLRLKKTPRGVSRGLSMEKFVEKNGKVKISFTPGETVCESNDDKFSSAIGVIVKGQAAIGKEYGGWDAVPQASQELCYARLAHLFDIEEGETPWVRDIIAGKFRKAYTRWRNTLHMYYKSFVLKGIPPRSRSPREDITLEKWQLACGFIEDPSFQKRSETNSGNRAKMPFNQTTGRTPFLTRFKNMAVKSDIQLFKETRTSKKKGGDFISSPAKRKYDEMVELKNISDELGDSVPESEIVKSTLGSKSGYVKGMGHGLKVGPRGQTTITAGIHMNKKLEELDVANEKIALLSKENEDMKLRMETLEKILMKIPAVSQAVSDAGLDDDDDGST